jgi:hypothetical protein
MNRLKWFAGGLLIGLVLSTLRDQDRGDWVSGGRVGDGADGDVDLEEEPVLGYDGMDQETLLEWIEGATLDDETIERMIRYESGNRRRAPVLDVLHDLLD